MGYVRHDVKEIEVSTEEKPPEKPTEEKIPLEFLALGIGGILAIFLISHILRR